MKGKLVKYGYVLIILIITVIDLSAQWNKVTSPSSRVFAFKQMDNKLFAGTEYSGIWFSLNGGVSWQQQNTGLYEFRFDVSSFESKGNYLFAGIEGGGVCLSRDKGTSWETFNEGFTTQGFVSGLTMIEDTLYAAVSYSIGMQASGVYKTHYQKADWKYYGSTMPDNLGDITSFVKNLNNTFFVGVALGGSRGSIYISKDKGNNWKGYNLSGAYDVYSLTADGKRVYAGTNNGIYYSDDDGNTWIKLNQDLNGFYIDYMLCYGGKIFAAADTNGIIYSNDFGKNWHNVTKNLPIASDFVSALFFYQDNLFASLSAAQGIWSVSFSTVGVDLENEIPAEAELYLNYPNPFNPETTISYKLNTPGKVSLMIFDVLGREVAELVNDDKSAGWYEVKVDGSKLSSGLYFYQLRSGSFIDTKKLTLIK